MKTAVRAANKYDGVITSQTTVHLLIFVIVNIKEPLFRFVFYVQPPKKDAKSSAKQPQKTQKKKEGSGGGKAKKKKWSKGKVRDKLNNQVLFDKATYEKLYKEVPAYKLITPSVVSERLKIRGSLAKRALIELREKGKFLSPPRSILDGTCS